MASWRFSLEYAQPTDASFDLTAVLKHGLRLEACFGAMLTNGWGEQARIHTSSFSCPCRLFPRLGLFGAPTKGQVVGYNHPLPPPPPRYCGFALGRVAGHLAAGSCAHLGAAACGYF